MIKIKQNLFLQICFLPPDMGPSPYPDMSNIEITCEGIACLLNELDPSKSHKPDDVTKRLQKLFAVEISPYPKLLFSTSLHQGIIPQVWKQAIVTPLFKKGNRSNPSNYRPISLLTCIIIMLQDFRPNYSHQNHVSLLQLQHTLTHSIWISQKLLCRVSINQSCPWLNLFSKQKGPNWRCVARF